MNKVWEERRFEFLFSMPFRKCTLNVYLKKKKIEIKYSSRLFTASDDDVQFEIFFLISKNHYNLIKT